MTFLQGRDTRIFQGPQFIRSQSRHAMLFCPRIRPWDSLKSQEFFNADEKRLQDR